MSQALAPLPAKITALSLTTIAADVESCAGWLESWMPSDPVPTEHLADLPALLERAALVARPASFEAFAMLMDRFIRWAERHNLAKLPPVGNDKREDEIADIVADYHATLNDLPADILDAALRATMAGHGYRNLPMPGDIRKHATEGLAQRVKLLRRLETAALVAGRQRPHHDRRADPETGKAMFAMVKQALAQAVADAPKVERRSDDDREGSTPETRRAALDALKGRSFPVPPCMRSAPPAEAQPQAAE